MSGNDRIQRSRLAQRIFDLWGSERTEANADLIESASHALARIGAMQPDATALLDGAEEPERD